MHSFLLLLARRRSFVWGQRECHMATLYDKERIGRMFLHSRGAHQCHLADCTRYALLRDGRPTYTVASVHAPPEGDGPTTYMLNFSEDVWKPFSLAVPWANDMRVPGTPEDVLLVMAWHPEWFDQGCMYVCPQRGDDICVSLDIRINITRVEFDLNHAAIDDRLGRHEPLRQLAERAMYYGLFIASRARLLNLGIEAVCRPSRWARTARIDPSHIAHLTHDERNLVGWLQHQERLVLNGEPLGFYMDMVLIPALTSTKLAFGFDGHLRHLPMAQDVYRVAIDSRGVVVRVASRTDWAHVRPLVEFILGSSESARACALPALAGDPAVDTSVSVDKTIFSRAIDFGASDTARRAYGLTDALLHTNASLVIVPDAEVVVWTREAAFLYPYKSVLVIGTARDHADLTYASVSVADLVIVAASFFEPWSYYDRVRHMLHVSPTDTSSARVSLLRDRWCDVRNLLRQTRQECEQWMRGSRPILEYFAWPRLLCACLPDDLRAPGTAREAMQRLLVHNLALLSARFVIAVHRGAASPVHDVSVSLTEYAPLGDWLRLGTRHTLTTASEHTCPHTPCHCRPPYVQEGLDHGLGAHTHALFPADETSWRPVPGASRDETRHRRVITLVRTLDAILWQYTTA